MGSGDDRWAAGSTYEAFLGRWSRQLAPMFVSWLSVPAHSHWLDIGCGTGALTDAICKTADPSSVLGCDPSEPFVRFAQEHNSDERTSFVVAGVGSLPVHPDGYGSITSSFVLNFIPEPESALEEMRRIAARDGLISACVWDYADRMDYLRYFWKAAARIDSKARELDEGRRFPSCRQAALVEMFSRVGLRGVCCEPIEITIAFDGFNDYWRPFLGGTGPAPSYVASLEENQRTALASGLDQILPKRPDGTIALVARAWGVRGHAD